MLQKINPEVAHALDRATESRRLADAATDAQTREFWIGMERRWMLLAESYVCVERTEAFLATARFLGLRTPRLH